MHELIGDLALSILAPLAAPGSPEFIAATGVIAVLAGVIRVGMGMARLGMLGLKLDPALNAEHGKSSGGRITTADSRVPALVVPTNEELIIARETLQCTVLARAKEPRD